MTLTASAPAVDASYFALLLEKTAEGSRDAEHELHLFFSRGVQYFLARQVGRERAAHLTEEVFAILFEAIRNGDVREPESLNGFVREIVQRTIASESNRRRPVMVVPNDQIAAAERILRSLPSKHREALIRFYYEGQGAEKICRDLRLTASEFCAIRNRARLSTVEK